VLHRNDHLKKDKNNDQSDPIFEFDSFNEYFRIVWAESILKKFVE
jgi:hypothetical protein